MVSKTNKGDTTASERLDPGSRGRTKSDAPEARGPLQFLSDIRQELDKVVWPDRQKLIAESTAVLLIVLAFAAFISLIDRLFSWIATVLFS